MEVQSTIISYEVQKMRTGQRGKKTVMRPKKKRFWLNLSYFLYIIWMVGTVFQLFSVSQRFAFLFYVWHFVFSGLFLVLGSIIMPAKRFMMKEEVFAVFILIIPLFFAAYYYFAT